jgi:shikimate kinase
MNTEKALVKANSRNLVLTGLMGTGKTCVGRLVAERLGREFVDMDEVIAAREGASIVEIFARQGEEHFRAREGELCAELSARRNLVIATGGGALLDPTNRDRFENAAVICLDAGVDDIMRRLDGAHDRPLLASEGASPESGERRAESGERKAESGGRKAESGERKAESGRRKAEGGKRKAESGRRIRELLTARRAAYALISLHVDTSGRGIEEVAREVMDRFAEAAAAWGEAEGGVDGG